jgi:hypothetical protein
MLQHTCIVFFHTWDGEMLQRLKAAVALATLRSWEILVGGQERRFNCHARADVATKKEHDTYAGFDVSLTVVLYLNVVLKYTNAPAHVHSVFPHMGWRDASASQGGCGACDTAFPM